MFLIFLSSNFFVKKIVSKAVIKSKILSIKTSKSKKSKFIINEKLKCEKIIFLIISTDIDKIKNVKIGLIFFMSLII
jgi:hypothetical protein